MANDSKALQDILDNIASTSPMVHINVDLQLEMPDDLVEFIQSTPDIERSEIDAMIKSLGIMFYNAIVTSKPNTNVWNLR